MAYVPNSQETVNYQTATSGWNQYYQDYAHLSVGNTETRGPFSKPYLLVNAPFYTKPSGKKLYYLKNDNFNSVMNDLKNAINEMNYRFVNMVAYRANYTNVLNAQKARLAEIQDWGVKNNAMQSQIDAKVASCRMPDQYIHVDYANVYYITNEDYPLALKTFNFTNS